jgi:ATP-binding cassette, subfamily C, bacterial LapB
MEVDSSASLVWLARRIAKLNAALKPLDPEALARLAREVPTAGTGRVEFCVGKISGMLLEMAGSQPRWFGSLDANRLPLVCISRAGDIALVHAENPDGSWLLETPVGKVMVPELPEGAVYCAIPMASDSGRSVSAHLLFRRVLHDQGTYFFRVALLTVLLNVLALATSLYSMQVYDRVIPSQGVATLIALTSGVALAICLELFGRFARSSFLNLAIRKMDIQLSHRIFERLLNIRIDQFPPSVGTLSAQLRGYETIRAFAMSATMYVVVDVPFALIFLAVIMFISGPLLAAIPLLAFVLSLGIGLMSKSASERLALSSQMAANRKLGLLVEAVDGAESVKATGAAWQFLGRWNELARKVQDEEIEIRQHSENAGYYAAFVQQLSYVALVATGAYLASSGSDITMGAIIAASILSGRVLQPVTMLPSLMVQWANAKSALAGIEQLFKLEQDNHGIDHPVVLEHLKGAYAVERVAFGYPDRPRVLSIERLEIPPGQKVAIIGSVGSGKSTLLKMLAGIYAPGEGRVSLDGLDVSQISRAHLVHRLGYMPQDLKLFAGTLRENLLAGIIGVSDAEVLAAAESTGLLRLIGDNPKGLDLRIAEGGGGLSGGQRQIVCLTRLLLKRPDVWLLDEPTASMDEMSEICALQSIRNTITPEQTLVLVTHKPALLPMVDRVIVMRGGQILIDGSRDAVLEHLHKMGKRAARSDNDPQMIQGASSGAHGER